MVSGRVAGGSSTTGSADRQTLKTKVREVMRSADVSALAGVAEGAAKTAEKAKAKRKTASVRAKSVKPHAKRASGRREAPPTP